MVIVIHGNGGHGKAVADAADMLGHVVRFTDRAARSHPIDGDFYITAIGDNAARKREQFAGAYRLNVIHPRAYVSDYSELGNGVFVGPQASIGSGARVGSGAIINTGAVVEHDCIVGEWSHIASGAILGGGVTVGEGATIGSGAVVRDHITVCPWAIIGCGAVVVADITSPGVYVGNPARWMRAIGCCAVENK